MNYNYNSGVDDRISRLSSISDSSATLEAYSYLGLNTVVTRSHPQTGINQTYLIPGGNPDGGDQYTGLDRFGRAVEQKWLNPGSGTATDDFLYSYDRDGNRTATTYGLNSSFNEQFGYDNLNQLTGYSRGGGVLLVQGWNLDAVGNWTSFTSNGSTQTRTFNSQNQLTSISGATTPTYDANGNTTLDDNGTQYTYDAWNRVVKAVAGSTTMAYEYDALGRRTVTFQNNNPGVDAYFSSSWQVLEQDQQGSTVAQFVWSSVYVDALVEQDSGSTRWYAQQDANWNVTAMVNSNGTVANRFVYDPFGKGNVYDANWNLQGALMGGLGSSWSYFFQGGRFDAIAGLYNFRNRDYSPTMGRWMQEDLAGNVAGTPDLYLFELGNPSRTNDPAGLSPSWPPGPKSSIQFCRRDINVGPNPDCKIKCAAACCDHTFVAYGVDANGKPRGIGLWNPHKKGDRADDEIILPVLPAKFCLTCYKKGAAAKETDDQIWNCIRNHRLTQDFSVAHYNCNDWAIEAVTDCGLVCYHHEPPIPEQVVLQSIF